MRETKKLSDLLHQEKVLRSQHMMGTVTGRNVSIEYPDPESINLTDICNGLAMTCRYSGQIPFFYSVAEHTMLVTDIAPMELKRAALAHDMAEAYIGDVISPLKSLLPDYKIIEERWNSAIFDKLNIPFEHMAAVKEYDNITFNIEYECFDKLKKQGIRPYDIGKGFQFNFETQNDKISGDNVSHTSRRHIIKFLDPYRAYNYFMEYLNQYFPDENLY